jgi:superfamily II RNA helicase
VSSAALIEYRPPAGSTAPDEILTCFLEWVADQGLEPYAAQEEAFLELMADRHVILGTPTGSGKSLVAALLHFKALCEGERSFYTAPTKALVSEKFFWLCEQLDPRNVGMLTGDASINPDAPVVCCTTEVLANMALRRGAATPAPYVVLDEFHYYGDRSRGPAWQIPLLTLENSTFLLMSATLGDTRPLEQALHERTGREVAPIFSEQRPVPLDFDYRETSLHESVEALLDEGRAPIYSVHFTQRECAEQAQALTSARICSREERRALAPQLADFRFDTAYGRELKRFLGFGIGVHHAGLIPKYRLLVEQLAQQSLLKVICGTDTLGVGVNIPIRTVLFSGLCKYDGERMALLTAREFKQIAGRAGRKGFDEEGSVVCQAPVHLVERKREQQRAKNRGRKPRPAGRPPRGAVNWNRDTFQKLIYKTLEPLQSRFWISHGMIVQLLQRDPEGDASSGYRAVAELIARSHESPVRKRRLRRDAARIFRSLRRAGIVELFRERPGGRYRVRVSEDLQEEFSLHHSLSLYLVDAVHALDPGDPDYALDVLSLVEAILENPRPVLYAQENRAKKELVDRLKAERVPYEERMRQLEGVTWPQPNAEFIDATFEYFAEKHPWLSGESIRPKSVARELFETYTTFDDYVRLYQIARVEGVLLRYLGQVYRTLVQNVPVFAHTAELDDVRAFLGLVIDSVDSSLLQEWESRVDDSKSGGSKPEARDEAETKRLRPDLVRDARARTARVRAELHRLVKLLAAGRFDEAVACVHPASDWGAGDFASALAPFLAEHERIEWSHRARLAEHTVLDAEGPQRWRALQTLLDPSGGGEWFVEAEIDLTADPSPEGPLLRLRRIGV